MATEAQVNANRKNALKSTGSRSARGKEVVAQNAVKHGLCSQKMSFSASRRRNMICFVIV